MDANDFGRCTEPGNTLVISLVCHGGVHAGNDAAAALRRPTLMPGDQAGAPTGARCSPPTRAVGSIWQRLAAWPSRSPGA